MLTPAEVEDYLVKAYAEKHKDDKYYPTLSVDRVWRHLKWGEEDLTYDGWTFDLEDEYGGEGQGEDFWVVISVTAHDHWAIPDSEITLRAPTETAYFRKEGWYQSFGDGGELDGPCERVYPKEVLKKVWSTSK